MKRVIVAGLLCLLPLTASAAGFATDPLFLSRTPVTEGQSVHIYAVISNTDTNSFAGTLVFDDASTKIGQVDISLAAGSTQTASVLWTPAAGTHAVHAQLVAADGSIAQEVSQTFVINPQPVPASDNASSEQSAATIGSSAPIQQDIAGISPQVASASQPVFTVIDGARNSIADALDGQIQSTQQKISTIPKPGVIEGTSTENILANPQLPSESGVWYWLYTFYLWLLQGLRWLVGNAGVFYPFIAVVFLYILWRIYRRYRRPY